MYSQVIFSVINGLQISKDILDLFSGIKIHPAHDFVRNVRHEKFFLKGTGLIIGPVQHGKIPVRSPAVQLFPDVSRNILRFLIGALKKLKYHRLSPFVICPECFFLPADIILNYTVGSIQDILRRTVVLFQFNDSCIWKNFLKIQNIFYICSPESVDGLIVVSHHTEILIFPRQNTHQLKLHRVCVLILVHHNITKTVLITLQHIRAALKELHRLHQQIIEIQCIVLLQLLLILQIDLRHLFLTEIPPDRALIFHR